MTNFTDKYGAPETYGVSDEAYAASWDGVTTTAPSKNAVYDKIETMGGSVEDPVLNGDISGTAFLDEDTMTSDSDTKVASQQSIKAYVDNEVLDKTLSTPASDEHLVHNGTNWVNRSFYNPIVTGLTDGATVNTDAGLGNLFTVTIAGNRTMAAPTNPVDGQFVQYRIKQDATGSRVITWNAIFNFGGAGEPTLTTTASKTDYITFRYNSDNTKWDYMGTALDY